MHALEKDKPEAPAAGVDGFDELLLLRSNRMSLKIMKSAITERISGAIPDSTDAKKCMASIEEKYRGNDKQYSLVIMHKLINTKHHISKSVREHIIYLCNLGAELNTLKMEFDDPFMIHLALVSLPDEYENLVSSYNNIQEKWIIDELISYVVLEEERLKKSSKDLDGKEACVEAVESIVLHLHSGFKLYLNNVLYVPSLKRNLISVRLLDIDDFSCNFGDMKCLIKYNCEDVDFTYLQDKVYLLSLYNSVLNICDDKDKRFSNNETSSKL
jgi:hypothetical protein